MNERSTPPWPEGPEPEEAEFSPEEIELAAELTQALARGQSSDPEVDRLVEAAELVKMSRNFELAPARQQALRAELSELWKPVAPQKAPQNKPRPSAVVRLARWLPLPIAAGTALLWGIQQQALQAPSAVEAPADQAVASAAQENRAARQEESRAARQEEGGDQESARIFFPPPSEALVRAQTELLVQRSEGQSAERGARATLDRELAAYRRVLLASLAREEGPP